MFELSFAERFLLQLSVSYSCTQIQRPPSDYFFVCDSFFITLTFINRFLFVLKKIFGLKIGNRLFNRYLITHLFPILLPKIHLNTSG